MSRGCRCQDEELGQTWKGSEWHGSAGKGSPTGREALALLGVPGDLLCPEHGEDRWTGKGGASAGLPGRWETS